MALTLSTSNATQEDVYAKLTELQRKFDSLNSRIDQGNMTPKDIDKRIDRILAQVKLVREAQEKDIQEVTTWGLSPSAWKWIGSIASGVGMFSEFAAAGANTASAVESENRSSTTIIIISTTTSAVGLLALGLIAVYTYGQHKVDAQIQSKLNTLKEQQMIATFLHSYKEFIAQHPNMQDSDPSTKKLKECIEKLKNIPPSCASQRDKDIWLSLLIDTLPDDHEIKKKLREQQKIVTQLTTEKSPKQPQLNDSSSDIITTSFLRLSNADQGFEFGMQSTHKTLQQTYEKNTMDLRQEFGMPIKGIRLKDVYVPLNFIQESTKIKISE